MDKDQIWSPPYNVVFATFNGTLDKIAADLPNRIDRTYLSSQAGSVQTYLIAAYRGFGLIKEDGRRTDELFELATDAEGRPKRIGELLKRYYPNAVQLAETNSTMGELEAVFAEDYPRVTGESRKKAIRFFLAALEYSGLPKSPLWKVGKSGGGGSGGRKPRKSNRGAGAGATPEMQNPPATSSKAMKQAYFDLLVEKAKTSDNDTDLLDRIERLLDEDAPGGSTR
jgi:hypothetical protein